MQYSYTLLSSQYYKLNQIEKESFFKKNLEWNARFVLRNIMKWIANQN